MPLISAKFKRLLISNRFAWYGVLGVLAGLLTGRVLKTTIWNGRKIDHQIIRYLALPGVIYMRLLICIIAPLLITSLSLSFLPIKTENPFDKLRRFKEHKHPKYHQHNHHSNHSNSTPTTPTSPTMPNISVQRRKATLNQNFYAQKLIIITFIMFGALSFLASLFGSCLMLTFGSFAYDRDEADEMMAAINETINDSDETIKNRKYFLRHKYYQFDTIYNSFLNLFPDNILTPMFMSSYSKTKIIWPKDVSKLLDDDYRLDIRSEKILNYKVNMISLCILSLSLGVILHKLGPERTRIIRAFLCEMDNIINYVMQTLMKLLPAGMFFWMLAESVKVESMLKMVVKLAYFYLIVIGAFMFWLLIFYPVIYVIFTRENPFKLYKNILSAIVVAFGSCSSAITLPETMRCMRINCRVSNRICQTVLPLGMTLHMNGPAMYFPMTAIFVAYIKQTPVGFYSVIVLCLFAVIMSMGLPPVIDTGTYMLNHMAIASVLGVENPQDLLAYILAFEWMMERIRTSTNIIGDCFAAKCIERILNIQDDDLEEDNYVEVESEEKL